jgi:hypothetical protein
MSEPVTEREESIRAFALEQAVAANPNTSASAIVRDAGAFLKFLNGEPKED